MPKHGDSIINKYFDHVYVLNLKKRTDRKIAMLQKLGRLGIKAEFVEAVDGYSEQSLNEYQTYLDKDLGNHPLEIAQKRKMIRSAGAWGYLKTYCGILLDAKRRNFNRILCFDDDAVFHNDFEDLFKQRIQLIPEDWKLLYLGASQHVRKIPQDLSYSDANKSQWDNDEPYYYPKTTDGSFAIGIDCSVFDLLLRDVLRMDCSFDSGPLRTIIKQYPKKCFVLNPNIVIADVSESDIQSDRNQEEVSKKLGWNLEEYSYPFQKDLVSVILPVYNGGSTVEKAVRSILLQTYSELELIIVDDASTDNTQEIVRRIMDEDNRIRFISFEENKGVYSARNEAIRASKGVAIVIQDADDISLKHRIEKQLIPIYENGMLFTVGRIFRSRCEIEELDVYDQEGMMNVVESKRVQNKHGGFDYQDRPILGLQTSIFRKSVFRKFGLFDELRVAGDLLFLERILYHQTYNTFDDEVNGYQFINKGYPISNTYQRLDEIVLISAKMNENNITNTFQNKQDELSRLKKISREKIISGDFSIYPKLDEKSTDEIPSVRFNTTTIDTETNIDEVILKLESSYLVDSDLKEVYDSLSWKITAPLRWIGEKVNLLINKT